MQPGKNFEILLRISHLARMFNSLDPSPFRERDLDAQAEEFIVGWAQEAPRDASFGIIVDLPVSEIDTDTERVVAEAIRYNFADKALSQTRRLRELMREGRFTLVIGMSVLAAALLASRTIAAVSAPAAPERIISESLLILGWVANWRPLEIFLYGWWPIVRRRTLYRRLADARVSVRGTVSAG